MEIEKTFKDEQRSRSLLDTVEVRLDSIKVLAKDNIEKFSSKIVEEYYESVFELITAIMSLDGYKPRGDIVEKHLISIKYMRVYNELKEHDIQLMEELRKRRVGIKYYGLKVTSDYLKNREESINKLIQILKEIIKRKLG